MPGVLQNRNRLIVWSKNLAYAVGLLTSDGCLSRDGRHIDFTSKDKDQIKNFASSLKITNKIGVKKSGAGNLSYRVQFSNKLFYKFLNSIGIFPAKSKCIKSVDIPDEYLSEFLRGVFDGDGYSYSYWDKRWESSFMFYIVFSSGSHEFILWIQNTLQKILHIHGHIILPRINNSCYEIRYSKREAEILARFLYKRRGKHLRRKHLKIMRSLDIVRKQ